MKQKIEHGIFRCDIRKDGVTDEKHSKEFESEEQLNEYYTDRLERYKAHENPELTSTSSFGCRVLFKYATGGKDTKERDVSVDYIANFTPGSGCSKTRF